MKKHSRNKIIEDQGKKTSWDQFFNPDQQLKSNQNLFLKDLLDKEAKGKIDKVKAIE